MPSYQLEPGRDVPARLGRYELLGHLATGGMAEIHLARLAGEAGFEKIVVVKRLLPELVASPAYVAMFLDEGKLVARLDHPNICEVHELGRDGAEYFLAMPYLDGVSVHELISRPRDPDRMSQLRVAAGVIVQACEGLHHAHELRDADGSPANLVHRDVSPSNLFVTSAGAVKVLDFGIAKVRGAAETEVGTVKGKSQYMAPEQVLGEPVDRRCDVFALGIVLFELATHQRLFKRASEYLTAKAVLEEPIPRADAIDPAVPAALAEVIAKALAREKAERFADARELAAAVRAAIAIAAPPEIAAAVTNTDELSAQRTRQAKVLGDARSRLSQVATSAHDAARTRPLRATAPPDDKTIVTTRHTSRAPWIVIGIACALLAAVTFLWVKGGDEPHGDSPQDHAVQLVFDGARGQPSIRDRARLPDHIEKVPPSTGPESAPSASRDDEPEPPEIEMPAERLVKKSGLLSIDSTPYATIYVDGAKLGVTPLVKRSIAAGRHKLRAVLADGRSKEITIEIPAGKLARPIQLTW